MFFRTKMRFLRDVFFHTKRAPEAGKVRSAEHRGPGCGLKHVREQPRNGGSSVFSDSVKFWVTLFWAGAVVGDFGVSLCMTDARFCLDFTLSHFHFWRKSRGSEPLSPDHEWSHRRWWLCLVAMVDKVLQAILSRRLTCSFPLKLPPADRAATIGRHIIYISKPGF